LFIHENHSKLIKALYGENANFFNFEAGDNIYTLCLGLQSSTIKSQPHSKREPTWEASRIIGCLRCEYITGLGEKK
jgi:hypothetical protein